MSRLAFVRVAALLAGLGVPGSMAPPVWAGDCGCEPVYGPCECGVPAATVVQHIHYRQKHWFGHCLRPPAGIVVPSAPVMPAAPYVSYAPMPVAAAPTYAPAMAMAPALAPVAAAPMPQLALVTPQQPQLAFVQLRADEAASAPRAMDRCNNEELARKIARALENGCGQDGPGSAPSAAPSNATEELARALARALGNGRGSEGLGAAPSAPPDTSALDDLEARLSSLEKQIENVSKACLALDRRLQAVEASK